MFVLDDLRKNFLHVVTFCAQSTIFRQFNKKCFNKVKNFFKSLEVLRRSDKIQIGSKEEGIFVLDGQRK